MSLTRKLATRYDLPEWVTRRRTGVAGLVLTTVVATLLVVALVLAAAVLALFAWLDVFGETTVDRSGEAVLERIQELEKFQAAEAAFVQQVDLEKNTTWLPRSLSGRRTVAVVNGTVAATVDLGTLDDTAIVVDETTDTIRLTLPSPVLEPAVVDPESIRVLDRERGLLTRLGDALSDTATNDTAVFAAARKKMDEAASASTLKDDATANTVLWLETFLGAAGFETVTVRWEAGESEDVSPGPARPSPSG